MSASDESKKRTSRSKVSGGKGRGSERASGPKKASAGKASKTVRAKSGQSKAPARATAAAIDPAPSTESHIPRHPDGRDATHPESSHPRQGDVDPLAEFFVGRDELEIMGPAGLAAALSPADEGKDEASSPVEDDYLSFMLADEEYAVPINALREIVRPLPITAVPRTAPYVLGVVTLRGTVLPVLDLRIRLGLPVTKEQRTSRILVIETDEGPAGIWADRVAEVVRIGNEPLEQPPGALGSGAELLDGIIRRDGRMLIVLNLGAALRVDSQDLERMEGSLRT